MNTEEKKQSRLTKKQKRNIIIVIIVLAVMILADFVWSNTYIEVKKLSAHFDNLPEGFEGCKIVQISDFPHSSDRNDLHPVPVLQMQYLYALCKFYPMAFQALFRYRSG